MDKVKEILEKLEKENSIKIIFAVEAGSRAWGLDSTDSDYDIRFVYYHTNTRAYLSLKQPKEVIDGFSDDRLYDWQGWDIKKALHMLSTINPSIAEWIYSPIVYFNDPKGPDFAAVARSLLEKQQRLIPLFHHYQSMAKSNYKKHIEGKQKVNLKKYLYVIRPAGMVVWLLKRVVDFNENGKRNNLLEIDFNRVLDEIKLEIDKNCYEKIVQIIEVKRNKKEVDEDERVELIDKWVETVLSLKISEEMFKREKLKMAESNLFIQEIDDLMHSILNISFN